MLSGGAGNDTLVATVDNVRDTLDGGAGTDTANYAAYATALTVNLGGAGTIVVGGTGNNAGNSDALVSIENFIGGSGADTITGSAAANVLNGGGGADTFNYTIGGGADTVDGGAGNDILGGTSNDDLVKGYEIAPDQYVVIEPSELDALDPKRTRTIEIEDFVDASQIDPILYDTTYYVAPATGGAKPYRLLVAAMHETGKVAVARIVLRTKEYLVALRPTGDNLELSTMLFSDEIVDPKSIEEATAQDGGLAGIVGSRRAKFWDTYVERFRAKSGRHERGLIDAFMILFAEMYDRQR